MGIIRKTFTFWLIAGLIVALLITLVMPKLAVRTVEKIPGRSEALKIIRQAKTAIKNLPENTLKAFKSDPEVQPAAEQDIEATNTEEPEPRMSQDSIATRDAELFKRQCAILDDLL